MINDWGPACSTTVFHSGPAQTRTMNYRNNSWCLTWNIVVNLGMPPINRLEWWQRLQYHQCPVHNTNKFKFHIPELYYEAKCKTTNIKSVFLFLKMLDHRVHFLSDLFASCPRELLLQGSHHCLVQSHVETWLCRSVAVWCFPGDAVRQHIIHGEKLQCQHLRSLVELVAVPDTVDKLILRIAIKLWGQYRWWGYRRRGCWHHHWIFCWRCHLLVGIVFFCWLGTCTWKYMFPQFPPQACHLFLEAHKVCLSDISGKKTNKYSLNSTVKPAQTDTWPIQTHLIPRNIFIKYHRYSNSEHFPW